MRSPARATCCTSTDIRLPSTAGCFRESAVNPPRRTVRSRCRLPISMRLFSPTHTSITPGDCLSSIAEGYSKTIWATAATRDLCAVMLADSAHIQEKDAEFLAKRQKEFIEPLYGMRHAVRTMELMVGVPVQQAVRRSSRCTGDIRRCGPHPRLGFSHSRLHRGRSNKAAGVFRRYRKIAASQSSGILFPPKAPMP